MSSVFPWATYNIHSYDFVNIQKMKLNNAVDLVLVLKLYHHSLACKQRYKVLNDEIR